MNIKNCTELIILKKLLKKLKTMLIAFYFSKGIIYKEFIPSGTTVNPEYFLQVLKILLSRIHAEYRKIGSWKLWNDPHR